MKCLQWGCWVINILYCAALQGPCNARPLECSMWSNWWNKMQRKTTPPYVWERSSLIYFLIHLQLRTHTHTHHTEATERLKCNDISLYRMLFCILIKYSHTSILYFILISSICICNKVIFYVLATILSLWVCTFQIIKFLMAFNN